MREAVRVILRVVIAPLPGCQILRHNPRYGLARALKMTRVEMSVPQGALRQRMPQETAQHHEVNPHLESDTRVGVAQVVQPDIGQSRRLSHFAPVSTHLLVGHRTATLLMGKNMRVESGQGIDQTVGRGRQVHCPRAGFAVLQVQMPLT